MLRLVCIDVDGTLIGESGKPTTVFWMRLFMPVLWGKLWLFQRLVVPWVQLPITPRC